MRTNDQRADRYCGADSRLPLGLWYVHLYTPWAHMQAYATIDRLTLSFFGTRRYYSTRTH